jgi:hypothetical protein
VSQPLQGKSYRRPLNARPSFRKNIGDPITEVVEAGNCLKSYAALLGSATEIMARLFAASRVFRPRKSGSATRSANMGDRGQIEGD